MKMLMFQEEHMSQVKSEVVQIAQMFKLCRIIGTTLSDNSNHLVTQMNTLAGEISSCLEKKIEIQESRTNSK